jgi:hypothetical protein
VLLGKGRDASTFFLRVIALYSRERALQPEMGDNHRHKFLVERALVFVYMYKAVNAAHAQTHLVMYAKEKEGMNATLLACSTDNEGHKFLA